ncbi:MAG: biotin--[acetyl-CoA-carboxylase] ligase [Cyanobacterium sp. T60_A2020_053]|nr:biotin--[acetyl-CoA-carboxylase] ligase [Cyanobacterium sp. T60_A2020_053]
MNIDKITLNNSLKSEINCFYYDSLTSTNTQSWQLLKEGIKAPFVVVAKQQTAGKGQRGNQWLSLTGGLYFTMMLPDNFCFKHPNHVTLLSAVAVVRALEMFSIPVKIKWLNDLILDHKKLGGILAETRINQGHINNILVGIGVNFNNNVDDFAINIKSYYQKYYYDLDFQIIDLLKKIINQIFSNYYLYEEESINPIIKIYNQYLIYPQNEVIYDGNNGQVKGADSLGNLLVKFSAEGASSQVKFAPHLYRVTPIQQKIIPEIYEI